ncbi:MAG: hypothetical protein ACK559_33600 [bacterium]
MVRPRASIITSLMPVLVSGSEGFHGRRLRSARKTRAQAVARPRAGADISPRARGVKTGGGGALPDAQSPDRIRYSPSSRTISMRLSRRRRSQRSSSPMLRTLKLPV